MTALDEKKRVGREAVGALLNHVTRRADDPVSQFWNSQIRDVVFTGRVSGMKGWLHARDGRSIDTLQGVVDRLSGDVRSVWSPGPRLVTVSASMVTFTSETYDWSERAFAGIIAIASGDTSWVGYDADFRQVIVYTTATRPRVGQ